MMICYNDDDIFTSFLFVELDYNAMKMNINK